MRSYRLTGTALDTLTFAAEYEAGNVTHTLDYVPGATVRGAFAAIYPGNKGDQDFLTLFESSQVVFEDLRPSEGGHEGFPIPLSTRTCKAFGGLIGDHGVQDFLLAEMAPHCTAEDCGAQLVRQAGWYRADDSGFYPVRPTGLATMHNGIDDALGTTAEGVLFTLHEIPAGTEFTGYVRVLDDAAPDLFGSNFGGGNEFTLRVGRDRGRLRVAVTGPLSDGDPWAGKGCFDLRAPAPAEDDTTVFTLTLISDAVLRDPWGRFHRTLEAEYLQQVLAGLGCHGQLAVGACYSGYRAVSGWRATHNLPTPKTIAVVKGSAARCRYVPAEDEAPNVLSVALNALEEEGLGDHRAQGYGRLIANDPWHQQAAARVSCTSVEPAGTPFTLAGADLQAFVEDDITRVLKAITTADAQPETVVRRLASMGSTAPLHALRNVVLGSSNLDEWVAWLEDRLDTTGPWKADHGAPARAIGALWEALSPPCLGPVIQEALPPDGSWGTTVGPITTGDAVHLKACRLAVDHLTREAERRVLKQRKEQGS